jgi:hypothetical protein
MCRRVRVSPVLLAVVALLTATALAGCGQGSSRSSSSTAVHAPAAAPGQGSASSANAVALVAGRPIAKSSYEHWLTVEQGLGVGTGAGHRALGFLITTAWLEDEASARGVSVSQAQAKQRLAGLEQKSFAKAGALKAFFTRSHESEADLLGRVRIELLQSRIAAEVAAGHSATSRASVLASFQQSFQQRWKSRTTCKRAYVMEDCSEYRGKPESQAAASSAASSGASSSSSAPASGSSSSSSSSSSTSSSTTGGVDVQPGFGGMTITSPAFDSSAAIPAQYTCDGSDVSPPLQWQDVPAKAVALVLFVIDDSSSGPASGIRWVVGDISPGAKGVAAGATPEGGIVGADTQGHDGYGGICPAHGKTSTIEFVLYALRKKIPLSPGFQPALAESEYGTGHDLLGSAAVTYAVYHRP